MKTEIAEKTLNELLSFPLIDIINYLLERNAKSVVFVIPVHNKESAKVKISLKHVKVD